MTYQPDLEEWCNRHRRKLIQHDYHEMLADTYNLTDEEGKKMALRVAGRMEKVTKAEDPHGNK